MNDRTLLFDTLPALQRLALAYCPRQARVATLALFALDMRFASLVRQSREPMLAQMRLAWWREILAENPDRWPSGEPLLACLHSWKDERRALVDVAEGWEALTAPAPLPPEAIAQLGRARGEAFGALSVVLGKPREREAARFKGQAWAIADIAMRLGNPAEQQAAMGLLGEQDWDGGGLSRAMRPLVVLHGMAARRVRKRTISRADNAIDMLAAIRLGLLGR